MHYAYIYILTRPIIICDNTPGLKQCVRRKNMNAVENTKLETLKKQISDLMDITAGHRNKHMHKLTLMDYELTQNYQTQIDTLKNVLVMIQALKEN